MPYFIVTTPQLKAVDLNSIQDFRRQNDQQHKLIAPHFTLVFAIECNQLQQLTAEISGIAESTPAFNFSLAQVVVEQDHFLPRYACFLLAEKGAQQLSQLHDRLYSGLLKSQLNHEIPFRPHLTIGHAATQSESEQLVERWEQQHRTISGSIHQLELIEVVNGEVQVLQTYPLG